MCGVELSVLTTKPLDHFCYLHVSEAFTAHMLVWLLFSTYFLVPVLGFHCWGFFSPAVLIASALVPLGLCQTWCNVLIMFFMGYSMRHESLVLEFLPTINAFLSFKLKIAGCLFFALLVAVAVAPSYRREAYTVAVLFGAFLGPGQLGCSFLMIFLFELTSSISYIRFQGVRRTVGIT